jgi:hypothetical protein
VEKNGSHSEMRISGCDTEKIPFGIKIRFLNLSRLWKFAQGDLERILTQGFFLNSSRILKEFRKIQNAMPWMQP